MCFQGLRNQPRSRHVDPNSAISIRETSRYQTDVTDEEWLVIIPHLPSANSTGRPRAWPMREIINGIDAVQLSEHSEISGSTFKEIHKFTWAAVL